MKDDEIIMWEGKPMKASPIKIRDWNLTNEEYSAILEYSWKNHLPFGYRISDDEIRSIIGRDKKLKNVI